MKVNIGLLLSPWYVYLGAILRPLITRFFKIKNSCVKTFEFILPLAVMNVEEARQKVPTGSGSVATSAPNTVGQTFRNMKKCTEKDLSRRSCCKSNPTRKIFTKKLFRSADLGPAGKFISRFKALG